jgi:hypothetical protein
VISWLDFTKFACKRVNLCRYARFNKLAEIDDVSKGHVNDDDTVVIRCDVTVHKDIGPQTNEGYAAERIDAAAAAREFAAAKIADADASAATAAACRSLSLICSGRSASPRARGESRAEASDEDTVRPAAVRNACAGGCRHERQRVGQGASECRRNRPLGGISLVGLRPDVLVHRHVASDDHGAVVADVPFRHVDDLGELDEPCVAAQVDPFASKLCEIQPGYHITGFKSSG